MTNDIKTKLQPVLEKDNLEETDVVYILSRVRKLLEIDKDRGDFKILNFYCNWALHSKIDDVDAVSKKLLEPGAVIELTHLYPDFDREIKQFLSKHNLSTKIFQTRPSLIKFHNILSSIYSDTPLILKTVNKKKITFSKIESFGENSGIFSATYEDI